MDENKARLADFKALTFDCYGTLIDWETGIWDAFQPLIAFNGGSGIRRKAALEAFAVHENHVEAQAPGIPYPEVLARVHQAVARASGLQTSPGLDLDFSQSLPQWPAFPDTAEALRLLKKHYRLVILSNVDRDGFAASNRKLGVEFDAIYTAQDIGTYKPDPANFEFLLKHLRADHGLQKSDILHTAQSLFHDHVPARKLGLATAWIDRQSLSKDGDWGATARLEEVPKTDFLFHSMAEMASAVTAEAGPAR
jgi:2-haloalkanoic acid dehalogenase type II